MKYVLGFLFSRDFQTVVLIRKNKPEWQAGLLNGIGGKIEDSDADAHAAMVREFKEETGVDTIEMKWRHYARMVGGNFCVECFAASGSIYSCETKEEEEIEFIEARDVSLHQTVENLTWLIALAQDHLSDNRPKFAEIQYP